MVSMRSLFSTRMEPYFLRSERLGFRWWTADDLDLAQALWGDARVTRFIGGPFSDEQVRQRLDREIAQGQSDGVQYWSIFQLADGAHVGCCGLRPYRPQDAILELGFHLRVEHWGLEFATESARAVIDYAFRARGARGLFAGCHPENVESRELLAKFGFHDSHDEFYPPTGLNHPSFVLPHPSLKP